MAKRSLDYQTNSPFDWDGRQLSKEVTFSRADARYVIAQGKGDPDDAPLVERVWGAMNGALSLYMVASMERTHPTKNLVKLDFASISKCKSSAEVRGAVSERVFDYIIVPKVCDWIEQKVAAQELAIPGGLFPHRIAIELMQDPNHCAEILEYLLQHPPTEEELEPFPEGRGNEGNPELDAAIRVFCEDVWIDQLRRSLSFSRVPEGTKCAECAGTASGPLIRALQFFILPIAPEKSSNALADIVDKIRKSKSRKN